MFLNSHQITMLSFQGKPLIIPILIINPEVGYVNKGGDSDALAALMHTESAAIFLLLEQAV